MANSKTFKILGEKWTLKYVDFKDMPIDGADGACDKTVRTIWAVNKSEENELECFEAYQKKIVRHEVIHAFLFESGLQENWKHDETWGHDETFVDWFACQYPKMQKVFEELGVEGGDTDGD